MKKLFRKAITVLGSVALVGATIGGAAAAAYPAPFDSGTYAVVYGASSEDSAAATTVAGGLPSLGGTTTLTDASGVSEDEVEIGGMINLTTGSVASKIVNQLTDSKISTLLDEKINWDDGGASGADDYNIHEEILVGSMAIHTTFNDNDFEELLALTNDKALEYRYVFDDAFNASGVGTTNADDLFLTILGQEYEISAMSNTSITVVTSKEYSVAPGGSVTVDGKIFTLDDLSGTSAKVNGETIANGNSKKINGLQVEVKTDSIFYNENFPEQATVTLKIGADISKTYSAGEEYIGEDEDDPMWVWTVSNPSEALGYFGVKYNQKETRDTDDVVYEGGSYMLPENFGEVKFDGITDVTYEDFKIYFDDTEDLWNNSDETSTAQTLDSPVLIIESVNGVKDSIKLDAGAQETSKIYLRWAVTTDETQGSTITNGSLEIFYSDVDSTVQDSIKPRFAEAFTSTLNTSAALSDDIGDIVVGDTTIQMQATITAGVLNIIFTDGGAGQTFTVKVGGDAALNDTAGNLKWFGDNVEAADKEDALAGDMLVDSTSVGTYDNDIMTTNGQIIQAPEANLDNDEVIFSVPSDRVYAIVSVTAGGTATTSDTGVATFMDNQASSFAGKNIVVVGGSCINSVAAELLGSAYCGEDFTTATTVGPGQFLIQSFAYGGKIATLVAGYDKDDTTKAVTYLANGVSPVPTTGAGDKYVGQSVAQSAIKVS